MANHNTRDWTDHLAGGLCLLSGIECLRLGLDQPAGSILLSPWLDPAMRAHEGGNALVETDYLVNGNRLCPQYWAQWLNGVSPRDPDVNPLERRPEEIQGLSPQLILVGAGEFALQESKSFSSLCKQANVRNQLVCEWGQLHICALGSAWIEGSVRRKTDMMILDWIKQCLQEARTKSRKTVGGA